MRMELFARLLLVSTLVGGLCQCAAMKKLGTKGKKTEAQTEDAKPKTRTLLVGTVELVNPEQQYVLILRDPSMIIPAGTVLTCLDSTGTTSKIVTTPEQKGNYIAADIQQGSPRLKNLVLHVVDESAESFVGIPPQTTTPGLPPGIEPLPLDAPLDSGLPPLEQDNTVEPGSIPIPSGGIELDPLSGPLPPVTE